MLVSRVGGTFKAVSPMTEIEATEALQTIKTGFQRIFQNQSGSLSFEELYRCAYNMVIHKHGSKLYAGVNQVIHDHLKTISMRAVELRDDAALLVLIGEAWREHSSHMRMIRDVLMYMDRNFVPQHKLAPTTDLSRRLFQECILKDKDIGGRLARSLMNGLNIYRECREARMLRPCADTLDAYIESSKGRDCDDLVISVIEIPFLQGIHDFYSNIANQIEEEEYCEKALEAYDFETRLAKSLGLEADGSVKEALNKAWIDGHNERILNRFPYCMKERNEEKLRLMHLLFSKSDRSGKRMLHIFREEVHSAIAQDPENIPATVAKLNGFKTIIASANLSRDYSSELRSVAESVFDVGMSVCRALAEFLDRILRSKKSKSSHSDYDDHSVVDQSVIDFFVVFQYIASKDLFEACYRSLLARRLLAASSVDLQVETSIIYRLKQECGTSYTAKLESMLGDIDSSSHLAREWKSSLLKPIILSSSVWSHQLKTIQVKNLPAPLADSIADFERFYTQRFQGRKLTWIHSQGTAEVRFNCVDNFSILSVSTLQALILNLFNSRSQLNIESICEALQVGPDNLHRHLRALHANPKCPILTQVEGIYQVNTNFQPKSKLIKVPLILDKDLFTFQMKDIDIDTGPGVEQVVLDDRKHLIEATIVRIMKTKRQIDLNQLGIELSNSLGNHFTPSPQMIKDRLENLIEREFLARDNDDVKLFYYVA